jgi:adenylosuccinate synthase
MSITVVCGTNWGDEGKGRMVDYLAQNADVVVRYQGGNNAGHTIVNNFGTFKLHLVPSGICYPEIKNILGPGMVIDLEALANEIQMLNEAGIDTENIYVSDRAMFGKRKGWAKMHSALPERALHQLMVIGT